MTFSVIYEQVDDGSLPRGYYYAHIPVLDLTTHGLGIEGAKEAAIDLARLWLEERRANGETVPTKSDLLCSSIEIEDALFGT